MGGYAYADIADCGFSLNCCTSGDPSIARGYLAELLNVFETNIAGAYPTEEPLSTVLHRIDAQQRWAGPVLLVEPADNIGGGTPGDGTGLLAPLLATGRRGIVAIINDPDAARVCHGLKNGDAVNLSIGAKTDFHHGVSIDFVGSIRRLSNGQFDLENKKSHLASMMGTHIDMGLCAVVQNEQATILLTTRKTPPMDLGQLHSQGITLQDGDLVVVKAAVSHKDAYDPIAAASFNVDSIGLCTSNLTALSYRKMTGKQISAS
jgi:microcystin degradation protein MlrC